MTKINRQNKGFTLIETLISLFIFSMMSVAVVNIFSSAINTQTRILRNQELMNQGSYVLEYMTKAVRMAQKDASGECTGTAGYNYGVGSDSIAFLAYDSQSSSYRCTQFFLEDNAIKQRVSTDETSANFQTAEEMTSSAVKVDSLVLAVTGDSLGDALQPKTTIAIKMESNTSFSNNPSITMQTSVSQRLLDI